MNTAHNDGRKERSGDSLSRRDFLWGVALAGTGLALQGKLAAGAQAQGVPPDPFAGDARLLTKQTFRLQAVPLRSLLTALSKQTGVGLSAAPSLAETRLTLFAHARPLAEILRVVATFLHGEWQSGSNGGYTLRQSGAAAKEDAQALEARIQEGAALILQDAEALLREESMANRPLGDHEWLVCTLLRSLSRDQIATLIRNGTNVFIWPSFMGCADLPLSVIEATRQQHKAHPLESHPTITEADFVRVEFTSELNGAPRLHSEVTVGLSATTNGERRIATASSLGGPLGLTLPRYTTGEPPSPAPPNWKADPALTVPLDFSFTVPPFPPSLPPDQPLPSLPPLSEALDRLDQVHPMDIIADAFYTSRVGEISAPQTPLGEILTRLATPCTHRWWKQDGFVLMQSRNEVAERRAEPPITAVTHWVERFQSGALTLEDCADIAALPEPQLRLLDEMAHHGDFPLDLFSILRSRVHLILWKSLTPEQRGEARLRGVSYARLTRAQQQAFLFNVADPLASYIVLYATDRMQREILPECRLRVTIQDSLIWRVRDTRATIQGVRSTEEALAHFRFNKPELQPSDIQEGACQVTVFIYESDKHHLARSVEFALPPQWKT